ncbi:MAG: DUF3592 domain-containing protein [Anaerolineales bacterium]|nr:DUF3592 domain-containing protein [Anaerolineales bacterium]
MYNRFGFLGSGCLLIILNLFCLVFLAVGGWWGYGSFRLVQAGATTSGRVVDILVSSDDDGDSYAPVVEYTVRSLDYQLIGTYTNPPAYAVGDRVTVRYDRANPETARLDSFVELWLFPLVFGGVGLLLFIIINVGYVVSLARRTWFR